MTYLILAGNLVPVGTTLVTPNFLSFFNISFGMVQIKKKLIYVHKAEKLVKMY